MAWRRIHSTMWENAKRDETLAVTATGSGGILTGGYSFAKGWVAELFAKGASQRSVWDTKAEALKEVKRYMRKHP